MSEATITVRGRAAGTATVIVTARDPGGLTVRQAFDVTVRRPNRAPTVANEIPDRDGALVGGRYPTTLTAVFTDPDG